jgi:hypothetical protein
MSERSMKIFPSVIASFLISNFNVFTIGYQTQCLDIARPKKSDTDLRSECDVANGFCGQFEFIPR